MSYQNNFWKKYFKYYDVLLKVIPYQELFEKIVASLDLKDGLSILDVGSGTGNLQYFIRNRVNLKSLDYSDEALQRLQQKFPGAEVIKYSILERLPYPDNYFDRLVSNNVLYTLKRDQWEKVLLELKRISKPGSIIVVSNLNEDFNAITIYKDHIRKSLTEKGFLKTVIELCALAYPTVQMIRYNKIISVKNEDKIYSFLKNEEQKEVFQKSGFECLRETDLVYSDQAYLNVFKNIKLR